MKIHTMLPQFLNIMVGNQNVLSWNIMYLLADQGHFEKGVTIG